MSKIKIRYGILEVLKMISENESLEFIKDNDNNFEIFKTQTGGLGYGIIGDGETGTVNIFEHIRNNTMFIIKEKEYMTFDEAKKHGTPRHKDFGHYLPEGFHHMSILVEEMNKNVWIIK